VTNQTKLLTMGLLVALIIGLLFYIRKPSYNWSSELYKNDYDQPYGLMFLDRYLKTQFEGDNFQYADSALDIELPKLTQDAESYNYLFVGKSDFLKTGEVNSLMQFVKKGNNAFYISKNFPRAIFRILHRDSCQSSWGANNYIYQKSVDVQLLNEDFESSNPVTYARIKKDKEVDYKWNFIPKRTLCESSSNFENLGSIDEDKINFFRVKHGEGYFYFNSNPELFTNFYLSQGKSQVYAEEVFSFATANRMIWDKQLRRGNGSGSGQSDSDDEDSRSASPLSFILSITNLKWALYVLMGSLFVYFVFQTKRKQRPIPILPTKENSSIEYVETISELYFQQKGHDKIFKYIRSQLYEFIRKRYKISTKNRDENFIKVLSNKSKVNAEKVTEMVDYGNINVDTYNDKESLLAKYHQLVQYFYNHCK